MARQGRQSAGEYRSARSEDRGCRRTQPHDPHLCPRPDDAVRLSCCRCNAGTRKRRARWSSEKWKLRRGRLFLVPGDSPVGYRLPLSSLPWVPPSCLSVHRRAGPARRSRRLARSGRDSRNASNVGRPAWRSRNGSNSRLSKARCVPRFRSSRATERSACSCRRSRRLKIISNFSPRWRPRRRRERMPVHIEGYPPPFDPRLDVIKVTPDPGVIEVNVHPAATWRAAVATTQGPLRRRAPCAARRRQVHDRRTPHRHRRRQSYRLRRTDARPIRPSCAGPTC